MTAPRLLDRRTATELRAIEGRAHRDDDMAFATAVRLHGRRVHYALVAERLDLVEQSAGAIVVLADRRLRQLGGSDAA